MEEVKIVDVIKHQAMYSVQWFVVINRPLRFIYTEYDDGYFIGEDGGFYNAYKYEKGTTDGFAGREITLQLSTGESRTFRGSLWSAGFGGHLDHLGIRFTNEFGVASVGELFECNVFCGGQVFNVELVNEWLRNNEPSLHYDKYAKESNLEYISEIEQKNWNEFLCGDSFARYIHKPVGKQSARKWKRKGIPIMKHEGQRYYNRLYAGFRKKVDVILANEPVNTEFINPETYNITQF